MMGGAWSVIFDDDHAGRSTVQIEINTLALITSNQFAARVFRAATLMPTAGRMTRIGFVRATHRFWIVASMGDGARRAQTG
jgi:hypothetical protein